MRLLIINGIYGSKSSGRSIADIKENMERNGHTVYIATPEYYSEDNIYTIGNKYDHKLHAIMSRLTGKQAYFSKHATQKLIHYIERVKPDVVQMQVIHGNYINFKLIMAYFAKAKIPVVFVLDDCWYFTGKCCHYIGNRCYKWKTGCGNCPRVKDDNPSWLFDFSKLMYANKKKAYENLDKYAVVAVSDWLKGEAEQSILSNANIITRIYNAIDLEKFQYRSDSEILKRDLGLENKHIVLGVSAAWDDKNGLSKGLDYFIQLSKTLPEDMEIVLVGKMDKTTELPINIHLVDFVDGAEELSRYYSMADVFIQMSAIETFGKVTAEALCCGTPVIVFNSTANPELVGDGCGYVVEPGNVAMVLDRIKVICNTGRETYSRTCRKFAADNFDSVQNAKMYYSLYEELLNGD